MKFNTLFAIILAFTVCSCNQQKSKIGQQLESITDQQRPLKSGLQIENGINRGVNYTDQQGNDYSIRYIPIKIANDSTIPIKLKISFSTEYTYPFGDQKFNIVPLPTQWALDGVEITESMYNELAGIKSRPSVTRVILPDEKWVFAIGTIYPRPAEFSGVLPRVLFTGFDKVTLEDCDNLMTQGTSENSQTDLGLKLVFGEYCQIISCGQISYSEMD